MSSQELVELQKIRKSIEKQVCVVRKKAKKIKIKDLMSAENINERLNAFMDKLTLDDLLQLSAILSVAILLKMSIKYTYKLKDYAKILNWLALPDFFMFTKWARTEQPEGEPTPEWLEWAISFGVAYIIVKHFPAVVKAGSDIISTAKTILGAAAAG